MERASRPFYVHSFTGLNNDRHPKVLHAVDGSHGRRDLVVCGFGSVVVERQRGDSDLASPQPLRIGIGLVEPGDDESKTGQTEALGRG